MCMLLSFQVALYLLLVRSAGGQNWTYYAFYNYSAGLQLDVPYRFMCKLPGESTNFNLMMAFRDSEGGGIFTAQMLKIQGKTNLHCQTSNKTEMNKVVPIPHSFTNLASFYFGYTGTNFVVITQDGSCEMKGDKNWKNIAYISASLSFDVTQQISNSTDNCRGIECLSRI